MSVSKIQIKNNLSFKRKLTEQEKPEYKRTIEEAYKYLDIEERAMIIHGSSFPDHDRRMGSAYSDKALQFTNDFLALHGFTSVQLGPEGKLTRNNNSPYNSRVFSQNTLFIDLKKLSKDEYANILDKKDAKTLHEITIDDFSYSDFEGTEFLYKKILKRAFKNFKKQLENLDEKAIKLNKEFSTFKHNSKDWLVYDGLFDALRDKYKTNEFKKWNEKDKNLISDFKQNKPEAVAYFEDLKQEYKSDIEFNSFTQFLIDKQQKENKTERKVDYIGDLLVGFSPVDEWANQDAFLTDWRLGCPFGGENNGPQFWDLPVLNPDKFFDKNGDLDVAGKLLKSKIEQIVTKYDNVRVDHALGLVDPYIYNTKTIGKNLKADNVGNLPEIDKDKNYTKILEKIILPTLKEHGVDADNAVWEDLCTRTKSFEDIFYKKLQLKGVLQTEFERVEQQADKKSWLFIGSHDSIPVQKMKKDGGAWDANYLAGFLIPDPIKSVEREKFKQQIQNSNKVHTMAKFIALLRAGKNIQITFADFFGLNRVYNCGGQMNDNNWKLRLKSDYEDTYHKSLENDKSFALNMPDLLAKAIQAKNDMDVAKENNANRSSANILRNRLAKTTKPLLDKLNHFAEILKEKD